MYQQTSRSSAQNPVLITRTLLEENNIIDPVTGQEFVLLTSLKHWIASTVAELFKEHWNIEVFFKHIKTNLRIKSFVGMSENTVKIQIWKSLITIITLKALQQFVKYKWHLSNLINALILYLFTKIEINQFIKNSFEKKQLL